MVRLFIQEFLLPLGLVAVVGGSAIAMIALDVFTPADTLKWRRLVQLNGYETHTGPLEKLGQRSRLVRRLLDNANIRRQLIIAGREPNVRLFISQTIGYAIGVLAIGIVSDGLGFATDAHDWFAPPILVVIASAAVFLLRFTHLSAGVRRVREEAELGLGDMLPLVAVLTHRRGLNPQEAVFRLAECLRSDAVYSILRQQNYRQLIKNPPTATPDLYRAIGEAYGIPMFKEIGDAVQKVTETGADSLETFIDLGKVTYDNRLSEARSTMARAKILLTIPVAGMLIPLLAMIGAPMIDQLGSSLNGGS